VFSYIGPKNIRGKSVQAWQVCINGGVKNQNGMVMKWYFTDPSFVGPYGKKIAQPVRFLFGNGTYISQNKKTGTYFSFEVSDFQVYDKVFPTNIGKFQVIYIFGSNQLSNQLKSIFIRSSNTVVHDPFKWLHFCRKFPILLAKITNLNSNFCQLLEIILE